jgi:hypothetical protein
MSKDTLRLRTGTLPAGREYSQIRSEQYRWKSGPLGQEKSGDAKIATTSSELTRGAGATVTFSPEAKRSTEIERAGADNGALWVGDEVRWG